MKKLKVLYDFGPAYRKDKTGIPVFVESICAELSRRKDIELTVTADISRLFPSRFKLLFRLVEKKLYYDLYVPIQLIFGKYDIYIESQYMYIPLIKQSRAKIVTFVYDIGLALFDDIQTRPHINNWRAKFSISVRNSDTLVTISKSSLLDIQDYLVEIGMPEKKLDYIYANSNHIETSGNATLYKDFGIRGGYFLYLGTLEPRKNPMNIVRAFKKFKSATKSSVKLVFAGRKGWLYEDVFKFVSTHNLESEVIFTGFVSEEGKAHLLRNATAFVFLSIYEGFGIPPLEALKLGVPTLLSDIAVFRELFEDSALYVDPRDNEAIAVAMSRILIEQPSIDPSLFEKFSWNQSADKLVSIMKSAVYGERA